MKIVKYSKSYKNVTKLQKNYLIENLNNLKNELRINNKYIRQKKKELYKLSKEIIQTNF